VLVTGAAGFIGSTLVERLLAKAARGRLDNFDPFYPESHKQREPARGAALDATSRSCAPTARRRPRCARCSRRRVDAVVHLAALAGVRPSLERPRDTPT
jgi:UDP-glucuronate 4-epimerase